MDQNNNSFVGGTKDAVKKEDVNEKDIIGNTPLYGVMLSGNIEKARHLLELGADPNIPGSLDTPLEGVVHRRNKEMVSLLLSHGAEVKFRKDGTAYILSSLEVNKNEKIFDIILCHFSDIEKKDSVGLSPIHWAARRGFKDIETVAIDI